MGSFVNSDAHFVHMVQSFTGCESDFTTDMLIKTLRQMMVEVSDEIWVEDVGSRNPEPLLRTVALPVDQVLESLGEAWTLIDETRRRPEVGLLATEGSCGVASPWTHGRWDRCSWSTKASVSMPSE